MRIDTEAVTLVLIVELGLTDDADRALADDAVGEHVDTLGRRHRDEQPDLRTSRVRRLARRDRLAAVRRTVVFAESDRSGDPRIADLPLRLHSDARCGEHEV